MEFDRAGLAAWQAGQPLSVLQLDTADRTVLRIAGEIILDMEYSKQVLSCNCKLTACFRWTLVKQLLC